MDEERNALYDHSLAMYRALAAKAEKEKVGEQEVLVYKGSIVLVFNSLSISRSWYSRVIKALENSGCINVVQRGARYATSVVILNEPPSSDLREATLTRGSAFATINNRLNALETRMGGLNILEGLKNVEERLQQQDARMKELEEQVNGKK